MQTCVLHLIRNSFRYASRKYWDQIAKDLRPIYTAPTEAAAEARFAEFTERWGGQYPMIAQGWRETGSTSSRSCRSPASCAAPSTRRMKMSSPGSLLEAGFWATDRSRGSWRGPQIAFMAAGSAVSGPVVAVSGSASCRRAATRGLAGGVGGR